MIQQYKRGRVAFECYKACSDYSIKLVSDYFNKHKLTDLESVNKFNQSPEGKKATFWARAALRYGRLARGGNPWRK
jgi:hypothetical protein